MSAEPLRFFPLHLCLAVELAESGSFFFSPGAMAKHLRQKLKQSYPLLPPPLFPASSPVYAGAALSSVLFLPLDSRRRRRDARVFSFFLFHFFFFFFLPGGARERRIMDAAFSLFLSPFSFSFFPFPLLRRELLRGRDFPPSDQWNVRNRRYDSPFPFFLSPSPPPQARGSDFRLPLASPFLFLGLRQAAKDFLLPLSFSLSSAIALFFLPLFKNQW